MCDNYDCTATRNGEREHSSEIMKETIICHLTSTLVCVLVKVLACSCTACDGLLNKQRRRSGVITSGGRASGTVTLSSQGYQPVGASGHRRAPEAVGFEEGLDCGRGEAAGLGVD